MYLVRQDRSAWTWELDRTSMQLRISEFLLICSLQFGLLTRNGDLLEGKPAQSLELELYDRDPGSFHVCTDYFSEILRSGCYFYDTEIP